MKKLKETPSGEVIKDVWDETNIKLTKDEKKEVSTLTSKSQIEFLVDQYNQSQEYRIRSESQARSLNLGQDNAANIEHPLFIQRELKIAMAQEALNKKYLDIATDNIPLCKWLKSIKGIGPVFAAVIYSSFNIEKGRYATDFLSYAGLNDNNNPWLGTDKAKKLVLSVESEFVSLSNRVKLEFENLMVKDIKGSDSTKISREFSTKIKAAANDMNLSLDDIENLINKIRKDNGYGKISIDIDNSEILPATYIRTRHSTVVFDWHYSKIHVETKRKMINIKNGTLAISGKDYATLTDLQNYLAKPPYNTELKKYMYLIGEAFMKVSNRGSLYGQLYLQRKADEIEKNNKGMYAEQAKRLLESKNYDKSTQTYKALSEGKLSDGHITQRAKRYAVKLFISHVYEAMYWEAYHKEAPSHYVLEFGGHHDYIAPEVDYKEFF